MFKIYPLQLTLAAVAVGAVGAGVSKVLKITDGPFRWDRLAIAAFDANGVLVSNPNVTLKCKKGSFNIFSDDTAISTLQRSEQVPFQLPESVRLLQNEEITFLATGQSGNAVITLNLSLIGDETMK